MGTVGKGNDGRNSQGQGTRKALRGKLVAESHRWLGLSSQGVEYHWHGLCDQETQDETPNTDLAGLITTPYWQNWSKSNCRWTLCVRVFMPAMRMSLI